MMIGRKTLFIIAIAGTLLLISGGVAMSDEGGLSLVEDGEAQATIVVAPEPTLPVKLAVAELNHHIEKITGTKLPVADAGSEVSGPKLLVGESEATRKRGYYNDVLKKQEYFVESVDDGIVIIGRDSDATGKLDYEGRGVWKGFDYFTPVGTIYAVYDFLEKCCGVRWYLPIDLGTVIQRQKTLTVPSISIHRKPWADYRWLWPQRPMPKSLYQWDMSDPEALKDVPRLSNRETRLYWLRQRIGGEYFKANHSFYPYQKRFQETHPEYFAKNADGSVNLNQLNYASEAVVEQVVEDIRACENGNPKDENGIARFGRSGRGIYPLVPMDNRRWSQDEASQKLILDEATRTIGGFNSNKASRYVFSFVAEVARRVKEFAPDAKITALAYSAYYFPPKDIEFPDNVAIMVCKQQCKARTRRYDAKYYASLREWSRKVDEVYTWEYYNFPQWRRQNVFSGLIPKRTCRDVKKLHDLGIDGEFLEINTAKGFPPISGWMVNPAMQHLNYYFRMKTLYSAQRPIDELVGEYYELFYGPAADQMRKFFTIIEDTFMNENFYTPGHLNARQSWTKYCPPDRLYRLRKFLFRAEQAAEGQHPYQERVKLIDGAILEFMKASAKPFYFQKQEEKKLDCNRAPKEFDWRDTEAAGWEDAAPTETFARVSGQKAPVETHARTLWDNHALYVLFNCSEPNMDEIQAKDRQRDDSVFLDDCVELFVDENSDKKTYRHFVVNAVGSLYDETRVKGKRKTSRQVAWNSQIEIETGKKDAGWWVALRIPWRDFRGHPRPDRSWRMNFCRHRAAGGSNLAWSSTGLSFHVPQRFGTVTFVK